MVGGRVTVGQRGILEGVVVVGMKDRPAGRR